MKKYEFVFFAISLCVVLVFPWPTLPGEGLTLTVNLFVWVWTSCCALFLLFKFRRSQLKSNQAVILLLAGALFMTLPAFWTDATYLYQACYRLAALWGMIVFAFLLMQRSFTGAGREAIYGVIVLLGLVQTLLAAWQILGAYSAVIYPGYDFVLANGRPWGSFLQVNLLASFLATGLLCAFWLAIRASKYASGWWLSAILIVAGLTITESRTGGLGATIGLIGLLISCRSKRVCFFITLAVLFGVLAGKGVLMLRPDQLKASAQVVSSGGKLSTVTDHRPLNTDERMEWNRQHSGAERRVMIAGSLIMIAQRPMLGFGLGSFESQFPLTLAIHGLRNPFTVTVAHPHNELLYVWSEGGILAFVGLLLCLLVLTRPFFSWRSASSAVLMLPLLMHMMTEYPFYLSAVHAVMLVILFCAAFQGDDKAFQPLPPVVDRGIKMGILIAGLAAVIFMSTGLQSALRIFQFEHGKFAHPELLTAVSNPWAQPDRLRFDRAISDLVQFNVRRDPALLQDFRQQADKWLSRHNDANLIATMVQVGVFLDEPGKGFWNQRGCMSFPQDPRFTCNWKGGMTDE